MTRIDRPAVIGASIGVAVAFVWAWLGFGAILLMVCLGAIGGLIGQLASSDRLSTARPTRRP